MFQKMPKEKKTHNENRGKVCAICWNERGYKADRQVNEEDNIALQQLLFPSYNKDNNRFPNGLCGTDSKILYKWMTDKVIMFLSCCNFFCCLGGGRQIWVSLMIG